jgi:hypothetical protein
MHFTRETKFFKQYALHGYQKCKIYAEFKVIKKQIKSNKKTYFAKKFVYINIKSGEWEAKQFKQSQPFLNGKTGLQGKMAFLVLFFIDAFLATMYSPTSPKGKTRSNQHWMVVKVGGFILTFHITSYKRGSIYRKNHAGFFSLEATKLACEA